jgi:hypothetical protein
MIARCRCGKTRAFRGHRRHFTCPECREARQKQREAQAVEIACAGCGRIHRVQPQKLRPCAGYTCGHGRCKSNPNWEIPEPPIGSYQQVGYEVGGGFHEWLYKPHTSETIAALWRACEIRDAGLRLLRERH